MEDDDNNKRKEKTNRNNFPDNYVTIHHLRERWLLRQQQQQESNSTNNRDNLNKDEKLVKSEEKTRNSPEKFNNNNDKKKKTLAEKWMVKGEMKNQSTAVEEEEEKESVSHAPLEIDVTVKQLRVRKASKKKKLWKKNGSRPKIETKRNENDEFEVVAERKSDCVVEEVQNLSFSSANMKLNVGRAQSGSYLKFCGGGSGSGSGSGGVSCYMIEAVAEDKSDIVTEYVEMKLENLLASPANGVNVRPGGRGRYRADKFKVVSGSVTEDVEAKLENLSMSPANGVSMRPGGRGRYSGRGIQKLGAPDDKFEVVVEEKSKSVTEEVEAKLGNLSPMNGFNVRPGGRDRYGGRGIKKLGASADKFEVVVEKKSDSVTEEVEAKLGNLSLSPMTGVNTRPGGRERYGGRGTKKLGAPANKIEVVVEEKSDSVTEEVEAKLGNLSLSPMNGFNVRSGGRERYGARGNKKLGAPANKIEVVVKEKSDSVTEEVEAKLGNLSMSPMNGFNVRPGGRERYGGRGTKEFQGRGGDKIELVVEKKSDCVTEELEAKLKNPSSMNMLNMGSGEIRKCGGRGGVSGDKIEVVAEEKSDCVTEEVEAKLENLSMESVNKHNVERGGRERYRGGGFRKSSGGGWGGGSRQRSEHVPGSMLVWVKKGYAAD